MGHKYLNNIIVSIMMLLLSGCTNSEITFTPPKPTPTLICYRSSTTVTDSVHFAEDGETYEFTVYLPPCYVEYADTSYPVLYWTNGYGQFVFDKANTLIGLGEVPPFIIVMLNIWEGYGADERIVDVVIPYIDSHYRTQADSAHRSITGVSHGAAIALRAAFRPPYSIGRVAVLSGGIADGEQEKLTNWIAGMTPDQRPVVLIDVGDQDSIIVLTRYLTDLLDTLNYPYTFTHAPGGHNSEYWDSYMEAYLKWLMPVN